MPRPSTTWAAVSALATLLTGILAAVLVYQANRLASDSQKQVKIQQQAQAAGKVYLGEAPPDSEFGNMRLPDTPALAVLNTSAEEISRVWVVGHINDNKSTRVDLVFNDISSCTMYSIQDNVIPESVHFSDSIGHWLRPRGGTPKLGDGDPLPHDTRPNNWKHWKSGEDYPIPQCSR